MATRETLSWDHAGHEMKDFIKRKLKAEKIYRTEIVEIRQKWDKESKIRSLIPWYRNWLVFHNRRDCEKLEEQLIRFPKAKHDDRPDSLQMIYFLNEAEPLNNYSKYKIPNVRFDSFWFVDI